MLLTGKANDGFKSGDADGSYKKSVDVKTGAAGELSTLGEPFANNHPMTIRKLKRLNRKIRYFSVLFGILLMGVLGVHLFWLWLSRTDDNTDFK